MIYDAIIIGGGAAGLFCAFSAGRLGKRVLVLEHNAEVGRKILISGGGRCNFTNINTGPENFLSQNPHFCKSALSRYSPQDFVQLVQKHGIPYYEKKLGQLFCRDNSRAIVEMLLTECRSARVEVRTGCSVDGVEKDENFRIKTGGGDFQSKSVVVACGGLSFPKIGATNLGYRIARQFGLKIVETRPSLVALVLEGESYKTLAGVSVDALVTRGEHSFRENILFTHRGLSGPAILQISNYWEKNRSVSIDLLPDVNLLELIANSQPSNQTPANYLSQFMPLRFTREFANRNLSSKPLSSLKNKELERIGHAVNDWRVKFCDTEGYDRAEVTLGGVSTSELDSRSMESRKVKGLYFIGEVIDVTGWLGGYNFQWAWASASAAANSI